MTLMCHAFRDFNPKNILLTFLYVPYISINVYTWRSSPIQEHKYSLFICSFEEDDDEEFQKDYSDPFDDDIRDELVCMLNHDEGVEASRVLL